MSNCTDRTILNHWHPISAIEDASSADASTTLLGAPLLYRYEPSQGALVRHAGQPDRHLPVLCNHGYIWTCLGEPDGPLFELPEFYESDRRNVCAASVGVRVSAPRAVENFLDMGHFPYVHTGVLGEQPHTEVREYDVTITDDNREVIATRCRFYQPQAAAGAEGGMLVEYIYRVPHPYCSVLYKSCPDDESRPPVQCLVGGVAR